jgi:hypothetical protein
VCFPALIAFGAVVFAGKEKAEIVLPDKP